MDHRSPSEFAGAGQRRQLKATTSHLALGNFGLSRRNLKNQGFCNTPLAKLE